MTYINRKKFIQLTGVASSGLMLSPLTYGISSGNFKIKALAFDGFPIFDLRPVFKTVNLLFPDKSKDLIELWQAKQFSYQWLRVLGHKYKNFWEVTKDALAFALTQCGLNAGEQTINRIMEEYQTLNVWPDVIASLDILKKQGLVICMLSNMTEKMLQQGIRNSGTEKYFDLIISTDENQTYKPSPDAYQMAVEKSKLKKENILFVPAAGWDMAGAKWFGYPTFWVNRLQATAEKLDAEQDGTGNNLHDLIEFIAIYNKE
jgi:2-haloacid dehalogenase